jgi:hypothetical protein
MHVPVANDLADTEKLQTGVHPALDYTRRKYPGKVEDAIAAANQISDVQVQQTDDDMRRWLDETAEPVARVTAISSQEATLTKEVGGVRQLGGVGDAGPG